MVQEQTTQPRYATQACRGAQLGAWAGAGLAAAFVLGELAIATPTPTYAAFDVIWVAIAATAGAGVGALILPVVSRRRRERC